MLSWLLPTWTPAQKAVGVRGGRFRHKAATVGSVWRVDEGAASKAGPADMKPHISSSSAQNRRCERISRQPQQLVVVVLWCCAWRREAVRPCSAGCMPTPSQRLVFDPWDPREEACRFAVDCNGCKKLVEKKIAADECTSCVGNSYLRDASAGPGRAKTHVQRRQPNLDLSQSPFEYPEPTNPSRVPETITCQLPVLTTGARSSVSKK